MGNSAGSKAGVLRTNNRPGFSPEDAPDTPGTAAYQLVAHVLNIQGLGCRAVPVQQHAYLQKHFTSNKIIFKEYCPNNGLTTKEIIRRCLLRKELPDFSRTFCKALVLKIYGLLLDPGVSVVVVSGHSHGGYLATVAVSWINDPLSVPSLNQSEVGIDPRELRAHLHKLHLLTVGSIYTAHSSSLHGIGSVHQYLYPKDVALRCRRHALPAGETWETPERHTETLLARFNARYMSRAMVFQSENAHGVTFIMPKMDEPPVGGVLKHQKVGHNRYPFEQLLISLLRELGM